MVPHQPGLHIKLMCSQSSLFLRKLVQIKRSIFKWHWYVLCKHTLSAGALYSVENRVAVSPHPFIFHAKINKYYSPSRTMGTHCGLRLNKKILSQNINEIG